MKLVDSHCHLDMLDLSHEGGNLDGVIRRAQDNGVVHMLNVSVNLNDFPAVLSTAKQFPFVSASVGVHPNEYHEGLTESTLIDLGADPKIVAIGETGLDYFRTEGGLEWQQNQFRMHIAAAKQLKKPLIVHTRQARKDTLSILNECEARDPGGVLHCFTEDWDMARAALDMGLYISLSGIVTFKNATELHEVAKRVPMDRLLIETDCPYLAPVPFRGKPNEPSYVYHTAKFIAELREVDFEDLAAQTTANFFTLFKGAQSYV